MKKLNLNENFICRIWENPAYYSGLRTTDELPVEILSLGKRNYDSGPDYNNAFIKINGITYTGSIEIHKTFKDWEAHRHKGDGKYNNVILQVVFWEGGSGEVPKAKKSRLIPTLILSKFLTRSVHEIWKEIINNPSLAFKIPCHPENEGCQSGVKEKWVNSLAVKRLKFRSERIKQRLYSLTQEIKDKIYWEQVLFEFTCEAFGYSKNKEQFLKLSSAIDLSKIKRMSLSKLELDGLMFGMSGFLFDMRLKEKYIVELKNFWTSIRPIIKTEPLHSSEWNFFRLRPSNFPTVRIALASALAYEIINGNLLKRLVLSFETEASPRKEIFSILAGLRPSLYWHTHYNFGKEGAASARGLGTERINDIITNVFLPLIYLYSVEFNKPALKEKVLAYYSSAKAAAKNSIIKIMQAQLRYKVKTLSQEQGIIHLHNFYCTKDKCYDCGIYKHLYENDLVREPLRIILY